MAKSSEATVLVFESLRYYWPTVRSKRELLHNYAKYTARRQSRKPKELGNVNRPADKWRKARQSSRTQPSKVKKI